MKNVNPPNHKDSSKGQNEALDLIKARIRELYGDEEPEIPNNDSGAPTKKQVTLVDRFWHHHKDHPDKQSAWHEFYIGLKDEEKKQLWNEYHSVNTPNSTETADLDNQKSVRIKNEKVIKPAKKYGQFKLPSEHIATPTEKAISHPKATSDVKAHSKNFEQSRSKRLKKLASKDALRDKKASLVASIKKQPRLNRKKSKAHWAPLMISLTVGLLVLLAQYNPVIFALAKQYISPGDSLRSPVIIDPNANVDVGPESRIIIPKINVDVPVVYDLGTKNEEAIQAALEQGVVHYDGTSTPGDAGNNVIVGHSSNNFLNSGKYKFAFVLLDRLEIDDTFIMHEDGVRYVYKVTNKQVIEPTDFSLTLPTATPTATLITCTPPGTSWKRLVVQGEQISPTPSAEQLGAEPEIQSLPEDTPEIVPGNSPSLWSRFTGWIF